MQQNIQHLKTITFNTAYWHAQIRTPWLIETAMSITCSRSWRWWCTQK